MTTTEEEEEEHPAFLRDQLPLQTLLQLLLGVEEQEELEIFMEGAGEELISLATEVEMEAAVERALQVEEGETEEGLLGAALFRVDMVGAEALTAAAVVVAVIMAVAVAVTVQEMEMAEAAVEVDMPPQESPLFLVVARIPVAGPLQGREILCGPVVESPRGESRDLQTLLIALVEAALLQFTIKLNLGEFLL